MSINIRTPHKNIIIHFPLYYLAYQGFPGMVVFCIWIQGPGQADATTQFRDYCMCTHARARPPGDSIDRFSEVAEKPRCASDKGWRGSTCVTVLSFSPLCSRKSLR